MRPKELMSIALKFNDRINQQDLEVLARLMTDDHMFVDSDNKTTKSKKTMLGSWREFLKAYPD